MWDKYSLQSCQIFIITCCPFFTTSTSSFNDFASLSADNSTIFIQLPSRHALPCQCGTDTENTLRQRIHLCLGGARRVDCGQSWLSGQLSACKHTMDDTLRFTHDYCLFFWIKVNFNLHFQTECPCASVRFGNTERCRAAQGRPVSGKRGHPARWELATPIWEWRKINNQQVQSLRTT